MLKKDEKITMIVNLIKGNELVEDKAICTPTENIEEVKDGKQVNVKFECKVENIDKPENYIDLEIVSSEDINNIPIDSVLINPTKVDELIKEGKIKNYTSDEYKSDEIPVYNSTYINITDSEETGVFVLNGEFLSEYESDKSFEFDMILY